MRQSPLRHCVFRKKDCVPRFSVIHNVGSRTIDADAELEDDVTSESTCAVGGLGTRSISVREGVHEVSLAFSQTTTTDTDGRRLFEGGFSVSPSCAVAADVSSLSASQLSPALVMQQQPQLTQQRWLPSRSEQLLCEQRQLRCEPISYAHQVLNPERETLSRGQPPQFTWLPREQLQSQQRFQNHVQDEYLHFKQPNVQQFYQVNLQRGIAPRFASINRAICRFSQKAAPELADVAATCPFDRLRMLCSNLRSDTASASRFVAADDGAYASAVAQSSPVSEFLHDQAVRRVRGQRDGTVAKLPIDVPRSPAREEVSPSNCFPEPSSPVSPSNADVVGKTTACPVAATLDTARAVEDIGAPTAHIANYARLYSSLSASIAPAVCRQSAARNVFQLSAPERASGTQAEDGKTGAVPAWQTNPYGRVLRGAVSWNHLDAAHGSTSSPAVAASIGSGETAGASFHTSSPSTGGASRCCSTYESARCLSSSETTAETLGRAGEVANRLSGDAAALGRGSSVANAPDSSTDVHVTADRGELRMPTCSVEEFDDGIKKRSNENVLSDEVQRRLICPLDHADYEKPEKLLEDKRNQRMQGSDEEQQQAGPEHEMQQLQAPLVVEEHSHHEIQRFQPHENIVSVQRLSIQEDARVLSETRRRASTTFDGRTQSSLMHARRCYGLQKVHSVLLDTAAPSGSDASDSKGCLHEEIQKQKAQAFGSAERPIAAESQSTKKRFDGAREYASTASSGGDPAEAGVRTPRCCASELADLSVAWQRVTPPATRTSFCAATVAPPTATRETTDNDFRWADPRAAPRGAIDPARATRGASAAGRSILLSHPVHTCPPQATGAFRATNSSLPSFVRPAVIPQKHQNSQQQYIAPCLETPVSEVPLYTSTGKRILSSYGFTARLHHLPSGGLEKLDSINDETTALPTTSSATPAAYALRQSSTSENPGRGNVTELLSPIRLVLPRDREYAFLSPGSSGMSVHAGSEIANQFQGPTALAASYSTKVVGEVAITGHRDRGFPSYPTCFAESGFQQDLLPAEAPHQTHVAVGALAWTGPLSSYRGADAQEVHFRAARWVSHPVSTVQQQALQVFRSARRHCECGLTEERGRRQLRVVSCIIGTILIAGIFCWAIGIVCFRTTSHAVHYPAHSQKKYASLWPFWNMPTADRTNSVDAPSAKPWLLHFFNFLERMSRKAPHKVAETAIKLADVSACARPVATSAGLNDGSTTFSSKVAQFAISVLVRLSARRRHSPTTWVNSGDGLRGSSSASVNCELQPQHRQRNRGDENYRSGDIFARARWRRRESHGSSPIGTLFLYIAFFLRNLIPMMIGALRILIGYPLFYILRSLMLLMLRISASFACTAFVFLFAGRLMMERLEAFRLACTAVLSSVLGPSSRSSHSHSDITVLGDSIQEQYPSNFAPTSPPRTLSGGGNSEAEGPGTFDAADSSHNPAELAPCRRSSTMERPQEARGVAAPASSHGLTPSAAAEENFVPFLDTWVALAALRAQGLTKLGHLSGMVLRRSLHAGKTVVDHVFPFVSVAASAAVSFMTFVENFSVQPSNTSEQRIQQRAALGPEHAARVPRRRESETLGV